MIETSIVTHAYDFIGTLWCWFIGLFPGNIEITTEEIWKTILLLLAGYVIAVIILGAKSKVVVFYNFKDFLYTFMIFGSMLIGHLLIIYYGLDSLQEQKYSFIQNIIYYIAAIFSVCFAIKSFYNGIKYNKSVLIGIFIYAFRVLFSFFIVIILVGHIGKILDKKTDIKDSAIVMSFFMLFLFLYAIMVNGEDVYYDRNWEFL